MHELNTDEMWLSQNKYYLPRMLTVPKFIRGNAAQAGLSPLQAPLSDPGYRNSSAAHTDWSTTCRGTRPHRAPWCALITHCCPHCSQCLQLVWDRMDTLRLMQMCHLHIFQTVQSISKGTRSFIEIQQPNSHSNIFSSIVDLMFVFF